MKKTTTIFIYVLILTILGWVKKVDAISLNTSDIDFINQQISTTQNKIQNRVSWYKSYSIKKLYNDNIKPSNTDRQNDIWTYIVGILQIKNDIKIFDIKLDCNSNKDNRLIWCENMQISSIKEKIDTKTSIKKRKILSVPSNINKSDKTNTAPNSNTDTDKKDDSKLLQTHKSADVNTNFLDSELQILQRENATIAINGKLHKVVLSKYQCNTTKPTNIKQGYFYFFMNTSRKYYCQSEPNKFYIDGITKIDMDLFKNELVDMINNLRVENRLNKVKVDISLNNIAQHYADYMFTNLYFEHTDKDWNTIEDRLNNAWYNYTYYGENLAQWVYTAKQVFDGWYNSEAHKANLLNPNFDAVWLGWNGTYTNGIFTKKK